MKGLIEELERENHHLRSEIERMRLVVEQAPLFVWIRLPDGRLVYANQRYFDYTGIQPGEVHRGGWRAVIMPADRDRALENLDRAIVTQSEIEQEYRICGLDGSPRWFRVRSSPVFDDKHRIAYWIGTAIDIEDRKRAEREELRQSTVLDYSQDAIFTWDRGGRIRSWNRGAEELYGWTAGEVIGRSLDGRLCADSSVGREQILALLQNGGRWEGETRRKTRKGNSVAVMARLTLADFPEGPVVVESDHDITRQHRAKQDAMRLEERLRLVLDANHLGTWDVDFSTGLSRFSREGERIMGLEHGEYHAMEDWESRIFPEDKEAVLQAYHSAIGEGSSFDIEYRFVWPDESIHWVRAWAVVVKDEMGLPEHLIGVDSEVTAQKEAERALRESEERSRMLLDTLPAAVYTCDLEGRITLFNQRAVDLWGRTPVLGDSSSCYCGSFRLFHTNGDPMPLEDCPMAIAIREKRGLRNQEIIIERSDGSRVHAMANPQPLRDADGKVTGAVNVLMDITEQKNAEIALEDAKRRAEEASRAKDDFIATLSHELRTPLSPVLLTATSLEQDPTLSPALRDQMTTIRQDIELESRLIDDLLDLTKIARRKFFLRPEINNVHELLNRAVVAVREDILRKKLAIETDLSALKAVANTDPVRLQQVFLNLLSNAIKFTPEEGSISVRTFNDSPDSLVIKIRDSGRGIAPEMVRRIFIPFEQGSATGNHRYGGLGLGLSISKSIIELHQGRITVESPGIGCGSTFTVWLPIVSQGPAELAPKKKNVSGPSCSHLHILLVEDHESTRNVLSRILSKQGHRVDAVGTCEAALEVARKVDSGECEPFQVVVSDLGLPDGSGIGLMRELKTHSPVFKAVAISGYGTEEDIQKSSDAGFDIHLTKPIGVAQLLQALVPEGVGQG